MANPEHVKILQQGVDAWNNWRGENPRIRPDLSSEDLRGVNLNWIKFVDCDLRWVNLGGADLTGADVGSSQFVGADLRGACLRDAILYDTDLSGARLESADLTGAVTALVVFGDNDLSTVEGLEKVEHIGPCTVGIDTIYKSKGNIPEVFLRGCGVPEDFIVYMQSLVGKIPSTSTPVSSAIRAKTTTSPSGFMLTYRRRTSAVGSLTKMPSGVSRCGVRLTPPSGIMTSWW